MIAQKLDQLSEFQAQRDALALKKQELIDSILTPEIKAQLGAIDVEFAAQAAGVDANIEALTNEIRDLVIAHARSEPDPKKWTIHGSHMMAVFNKGKTSWDTKGLDGFLVAHPEINAFRKVGEAFVTFRKVGP